METCGTAPNRCSSTTGSSSSRVTRSARSSSAPTARSTRAAETARASIGRTTGRAGIPLNPGGDPPVGVGGTQTPPTAEGGALRSQDLRTSGDPVTSTARVIRIDPDDRRGNARQSSGRRPRSERAPHRCLRFAQSVPHHGAARHERDLGRRRRIQHLGGDQSDQLPPDDSELRVAVLRRRRPAIELREPSAQHLHEFVRATRRGDASRLHLQPQREDRPWRDVHDGKLVGDRSRLLHGHGRIRRRTRMPSSSPTTHVSASGPCFPTPAGTRIPTNIQNFVSGAPSPVQLVIGPGGDLFYVDINGQKIHRIQYFVPNAVISATPRLGSAPLNVNFDGSGSTDPDPDGHALVLVGPERRRNLRRRHDRPDQLHVSGARGLHGHPEGHRYPRGHGHRPSRRSRSTILPQS